MTALPHLALVEPDRLAVLEAQVERGLRRAEEGVIEAGDAFREIRDARVYRQTHSTWEAYCRDRFGIGRNYADKIIRAAAYAAEMGTAVPKTERALRTLQALGSEKPKQERDVSEEALAALRGIPQLCEVDQYKAYIASFGDGDIRGQQLDFASFAFADRLERAARRGMRLTHQQLAGLADDHARVGAVLAALGAKDTERRD